MAPSYWATLHPARSARSTAPRGLAAAADVVCPLDGLDGCYPSSKVQRMSLVAF